MDLQTSGPPESVTRVASAGDDWWVSLHELGVTLRSEHLPRRGSRCELKAPLMSSIHVYGSVPAFGTPDLSPFVVKLEVWLRLAGIPYTKVQGNPMKSPRGKMPWIELDGALVPDSEIIQRTLSKRRGIDLDAPLDAEQRARSHAYRRMLEEGFYFSLARSRWQEEDGWAHQVAAFSPALPKLLAPLIVRGVRSSILKTLKSQGTGRYTREEFMETGADDLRVIAHELGDKPWLFGDRPTNLDASALAMVWCVQQHPADTPIRTAARDPKLLAYVQRFRGEFWKDAAF
jgi:glutathione S-transferase